MLYSFFEGCPNAVFLPHVDALQFHSPQTEEPTSTPPHNTTTLAAIYKTYWFSSTEFEHVKSLIPVHISRTKLIIPEVLKAGALVQARFSSIQPHMVLLRHAVVLPVPHPPLSLSLRVHHSLLVLRQVLQRVAGGGAAWPMVRHPVSSGHFNTPYHAYHFISR